MATPSRYCSDLAHLFTYHHCVNVVPTYIISALLCSLRQTITVYFVSMWPDQSMMPAAMLLVMILGCRACLTNHCYRFSVDVPVWQVIVINFWSLRLSGSACFLHDQTSPASVHRTKAVAPACLLCLLLLSLSATCCAHIFTLWVRS